MGWLTGRDADAEREAELARQEEKEREERADRDRRLLIASAAGYRWPKLTDPPMYFDCPDCGGAVTLSGVERHIEWHGAF